MTSPPPSSAPSLSNPDKVTSDLENPIDAWILRHSARLLPALRRTGHTPNLLTTYSFLCGLGAVWCLREESVVGFVVFFAASYFFDCLDGQFARRYKMTSVFGDLYDHATDLIVYALIVLTVVQRRPAALTHPVTLTIAALALVGLLVNIGCQQHLHHRNNPDRQWETLDALQCLCLHADLVKLTRFMGYATFNLLTVVLIVVVFSVRQPIEEK
jgi:phosphatidylglycerophosphate synthase